MAGMTITKGVVDRLIADGVPATIRDTKLPGFGARLNADGTVSYLLEYRAGRGRGFPMRRLVVGRHGDLTPDQARRRAEDIRAGARDVRASAEERDPLAARRAEARRLAHEKAQPTVAELAERFLAEEIAPTKKPGTLALYGIYFHRHLLPAIGARRAQDVTLSEVAGLHRAIGKKAKVTANRAVQTLSGLFSWAGKHGLVPAGHNPAKGIDRYKEEGRERYLSAEELERLGDALRLAETDGLPWEPSPDRKTKHAPKEENRRVVLDPHVVGAIRLLLLTGCRLREILHLRWSEVDFERGMLLLGDSKTGRKPVVLSSAALAVLAGLPRMGRYVVAGESAGRRDERPRADLQRPWARIVKHAGLDPLRIHDLRHTFASVGVGGRLGLPVIGKLLGHRNVETTQKYAHLDADPLRAAADLIADELTAKLDGRPVAEVIPLRKERVS